MKAVGIKVLKDHLSRYLELVRQGEVVLVTDRDEVIAELRAPSQPLVARANPWHAFLETHARRGALRLAKRKRSQLSPPTKLTTIDTSKLLDEAREDRI